MDHPRLPTGPLARCAALLDRLNVLLSAVYVTLVLVLIAVATHAYLALLRPLVLLALPPPLAALHTALSLYFLLSISLNYLRCLATPAGSPSPAPDPESAAGLRKPPPDYHPDALRTRSETWRWCPVCRAAKPPRAHHCSACARCFLRLCHHCPAVARCVGRDNYPFFFRFVAAAWLGALFAAATAAALSTHLRPALPPARRDALFAVTVVACALAVAVGVLAAWHLYLLATGQTTIEWLENVQMRRVGAPQAWGRWGGPFNKGVRGNVREAFGEIHVKGVPWWVVLLVPVARRGGAVGSVGRSGE